MTTRTFVQGVLVMLLWSVPVTAQQASELYQRGLVQEHATGHLEDAIAMYTEAARAAGADRALAARALVRAAGCYEKLGERKDAAKVYADLMRTYPEQRAEVSVAQERVRVLRRQAAASVSSSTAPVIERYCLRCHSAANKSGGLDLATLNEHPVAENTGAWERVVRRMLARRDPPVGSPRPDEETYRSLTATLQGALDDAYTANGSLKDAERADDIELAVRLATLIWNDAPDASLLADAKSGRLHEPASVHRHVARMLRDPRSANLVSGFFATWLSLDRVKKASPDPALFPQIDTDLLQAMDTETQLFLASQLRDDRDAVEIWT